MPKDKLTLKDIAQALGLTTAAVSKALNDKPDISAETRQRVKAWAEQHGYVPDLQARRLVTGSSRTLGVLLLNRFGRPVREYFGFHLLDGLLARAQDEDFDVVLLQEADSAGQRHNYLDQARRRGITALVVYGQNWTDPQFAALAASGLPVASIDTPLPADRPHVTSDQRQGLAAAVQHVLDLGHRQLAYVGLRGNGFVARERLTGFRQAVQTWNQGPTEVAEAVEAEAVLSLAGGLEAGLHLLDRADRPTAVVCATDLQAYGVLQAARQLGLSVPGDLSLTGFDDLQASALLDPPLTTVAQDTARLGWTGADLALAVWKGQSPPLLTTIPTQLIARQSTGPAPHKEKP